jgi:Tfp pilus assembly protein PilF
MIVRLKIIICLVLAAITVTIYWPAAHFGIIYLDDSFFVLSNPEINAGLTWHSLWWALTGIVVSNWHPVTNFSFLLTHQFFGENPGVEHGVNIAFHAANAVLLFLVLNRMTRSIWRSAMVAAIFAWHPLRVESVAWIAERKDVLCGFFCMLALYCYAKTATQGGEKPLNEKSMAKSIGTSIVHHRLPLLFFILALMSKPMAVSLPFLLLLLDFWPLQRFNHSTYRRLIIEKTPFFLLTAVFCALTYEIQKSTGATVSLGQFGPGDRMANVLTGYTGYLGKLLWPTHLAIVYPLVEIADPMSACLRGIVLLLISIVCVLEITNRPYLLAGWFWYLIACLPIIGVVQVGVAAMADRYTYLPLIGPVIAGVWLGAECVEKATAKTYMIALAWILTGALALASREQVELWGSTANLFEHALKVTGDNYEAHYELGAGYETEGLTNAAITQYRVAAAINHADRRPPLALVRLLYQEGYVAAAASAYDAVLQVDSNDVPSRVDQAQMYLQMGETTRAVSQLEIALRIDPDFPEALNNLAWILATSSDATIRDGPRAVVLAERACELTQYRQTMMVGTLAAAYAEAGRFDDAITTAQNALELARQNDQKELLLKNQELDELYRKHEAYHGSP